MHRAPLLLALLLGGRAAFAGYGCPAYFSHLPSVQSLAVDTRGVVVPGQLGQEHDAFVARPVRCTTPRPVPTPSLEEMLRYRPALRKWAAGSSGRGLVSDPVECAQVGGRTYFGLAFYQGEAQLGLGGLGRYDPHTGRLEIRRPFPTAGLSVSRLVHDGSTLWIALAFESEGFDVPGGLYRYDWETKKLERAWTEDDGPCGYWINDLLLAGGDLWVATDLGASLRRANGSWDHFVPGKPWTPVSCRQLYQRLLETLPRTRDSVEDYCPMGGTPGDVSARGAFRGYLRSYRPRTAAELTKDLPEPPPPRPGRTR